MESARSAVLDWMYANLAGCVVLLTEVNYFQFVYVRFFVSCLEGWFGFGFGFGFAFACSCLFLPADIEMI